MIDESAGEATSLGNPFLGSWRMTSAVVGDDELLIGSGLQYIMTFRSNGKHSVSVSNDVDQLVCTVPPQTSCKWRGEYSYSATTLTTLEPNHPDPDERGEDTSSYVFCDGTLIFMDHGDEGEGFRLTFKRPRRGR